LAVATQTNVAHRDLGTELLTLERHGVTLALAWRADLVETEGGGIANGVLATLLDHACSLAAFLSVNDERLGGATMGLRVDHLAATVPQQGVHVHAQCVRRAPHVAFVHGRVFHPAKPDDLVAIATCTVAVQPDPGDRP
jgi:acyl-coenzyme A thioesterase PaaI-like protein